MKTIKPQTYTFHSHDVDTTLVFVHGGPGLSWHYFEPLFAYLAKDFNVFAYDQGSVSGTQDFDGVAHELRDIVTAQELASRNVVIIAHSYGSYVTLNAVQKFNLRNPLVLISWIYDEDWVEVYTQKAARRREREEALALKNAHVTDQSDQFKNRMLAYSDLYFPKGSSNLGDIWFNKLNYYPELSEKILATKPVEFDGKEVLKRMANPALSITGSEDRVIFPEVSESAVKYKPDIEFVRIQWAGHFPFLDRPEAVAKLIADFASKQ